MKQQYYSECVWFTVYKLAYLLMIMMRMMILTYLIKLIQTDTISAAAECASSYNLSFVTQVRDSFPTLSYH